MNFYWFGRTTENDFKELSDQLEEAGFYGTLLPYVVGIGDYFVKISRYLTVGEKLKYIVAIRPYTISPQYIKMIIKSINQIDRGRVEINFVSGVIDEYEKDFNGIYGEINDSSSFKERKKYLLDYLKVWNDMQATKPYVYVSGMTEEIWDAVEKYADANMFAYEHILKKNKTREINKKRVISVCIKNIEDVQKSIDEVKALGYEDIMFYVEGPNDELRSKIINFVKEYNGL